MTIKIYSTVENFLADNKTFLEREEAANNLMLGLPMSLLGKPSPEPRPVMLSVFDNNELVLSAFQTPPRHLIIYGKYKNNEAEMETLVEYLLANGYEIPGVLGPKELAFAFATEWQFKTGDEWRTGFDHLVFRLDKVENIPISAGFLRKANEKDYDLVATWLEAFIIEATHDDPSGTFEMAKQKIDSGLIYFWEDEYLVSMAGVARPTSKGITLNYVYTPPVYRGSGYASSLVAKLSELMLQQYEFCSLFTDLANPTSNKIYQLIGYRPIAEYTQLGILKNN